MNGSSFGPANTEVFTIVSTRSSCEEENKKWAEKTARGLVSGLTGLE